MAAQSAPAGSPSVSFSSFVTSLAASAMEHLGLLEGQGGTEPDLVLAGQAIELLALLQTKTRGNLDNDELRLIETLLADLKARFDEATKQS